MIISRKDIINEAQKYIGINKSNETHKYIIDYYNNIKPLPRNYRLQYSEPWGCAFISFIIDKCNEDSLPIECSISQLIIKAYKQGIYTDNINYIPSLGDFLVYTSRTNIFDCFQMPTNIGIVSQLTAHTFTIIGVDSTESILPQLFPYSSQYIRGFIIPKYVSNDSIYKPLSQLELISQLTLLNHFGNFNNRQQWISQLNKLNYDGKGVEAYLREVVGVLR